MFQVVLWCSCDMHIVASRCGKKGFYRVSILCQFIISTPKLGLMILIISTPLFTLISNYCEFIASYKKPPEPHGVQGVGGQILSSRPDKEQLLRQVIAN